MERTKPNGKGKEREKEGKENKGKETIKEVNEKGGNGKGKKGKSGEKDTCAALKPEGALVKEPPEPLKVNVSKTRLNLSYLKGQSVSTCVIATVAVKDQPLLYRKDIVQKLGKPIQRILQDTDFPHLIQYMADIGMVPEEVLNVPKINNGTPVNKRTGICVLNIDRIGSNPIIGFAVSVIRNHCITMYVRPDSPAFLAGLRFGDEILDINNAFIYKWSVEEVKRFVSELSGDRFEMVIRERPFTRKIFLESGNMEKNGFAIHNGRIINVRRNTTAFKQDLLVNHQIIEINETDVICLDDKGIRKAIENGKYVSLTIMPGAIYEHLMKEMVKDRILRFYERLLMPI